MTEAHPDCSHRPTCPGCPRWREPGIAGPMRNALEDLARHASIEKIESFEGAPFGYRHRARLAVRGRSASPKIGIFQPGTHRIVDIPSCHVHHPLINRVSREVKHAIKRCGVVPYADGPHRGALRSIQVVVERPSQSAQVVLVANDDHPAALEPLAQTLSDALGEALHSLWWNGNPERTNVILGEHWQHLAGPEAVRERTRGVDVFHPPGAFGQSNLDLADTLVERIAHHVPDGSRIAELYGGCGAIGLRLVPESRSLAINELNPHSLRGLAMGIDSLDPGLRDRVRVLSGSADEHAGAMLDECDVAIVDPPRKGLDASLMDALGERPPARFISVSCDLDSFLHDCESILEAGRLRLVALERFLFLPHTLHVETLGVFERAG